MVSGAARPPAAPEPELLLGDGEQSPGTALGLGKDGSLACGSFLKNLA